MLRSIDNTFSFRFTRPALIRALHRAGFTSVLECAAPFEPGKASDRITLLATAGRSVVISTYPWVNGKSEDELSGRIAALSAGVTPVHGRDDTR